MSSENREKIEKCIPQYMNLLYSYTFTQQNDLCDWLMIGHVPLIP